MSKNATTQCESCEHNQVCKHRQILATVSVAVSETIDKLGADDNKIDTSFIHPIELKCKYHHEHVVTARRG